MISIASLTFALTAQAEGSKGSSATQRESSGQSSSGESATSSGATSSGTTSTESSKSSGGKVSRADERLMMQLAQANIADINAGKLAEQKSSNDQVKSFAKKMVDDHTKALDDLKQIASSKGVTLPTEPDRQQMAMENKLSALSGEKFDAQYIDQSGSRAHRDTHRLLQRASSRATDPDLKSYASKVMATVESHQQLARDTSKNLQSTSEGKSGSGMESGNSGSSKK
jgi:putative membrane protein